jgi:hypothetical protein
MAETPQGEVPAHVHDYDEDGDCVHCGRDLFAGGEDGTAGGDDAVTAQTPGQAFHESLNAATAGSLLPWDDLEGQFRDDIENAVKAAVEAARLAQPEELRQAMAETRKLREDLAAMAARWKDQAAMHDRDAGRVSRSNEMAALAAKSRVYTANAGEVLEMIGAKC